MQPSLNDFENTKFVIGNTSLLIEMANLKPLQPFSEVVISFLDDLSKKLLRANRGFSDVATFGFWCRKAHLLSYKNAYVECDRRLGRGVVFHSTPSNVAVNFAFSFAAGLLAGNGNIVRLPAKDFEQVDIICSEIEELLEGQYQELKPYICMLKFPFDEKLLKCISNICDCRVIWGGDETIFRIRAAAMLPPRANEITFADRYSLLVVNSEGYLRLENKERIAEEFYNDTYLSDQNACTSPRVIIWQGEMIEEAKRVFWQHVQNVIDKYDLKAVQAVGKLHALYKVAVFENVKQSETKDNKVTRLMVENLSENLMDYKYNSGFFYEYDMKEFEELRPLLGNKCQTISYLGADEEVLRKEILKVQPRGVDRIVPLGKTMEFSLVWDGYDLIRTMSREITGLE